METTYTDADRRFLFLGAYSNGEETSTSSYAFDAVSMAFNNDPGWTQWMGVALRDLENSDKSLINRLIAENQKIARQTGSEVYHNASYGGWSPTNACAFIGSQIDFKFGYVLGGDGVGFSMKFPTEPTKWAMPDRSSMCLFDYELWGNQDHIFRITLRVAFDEPQNNAPHWGRFETTAKRLLIEALPNMDTTEIKRHLTVARPYHSQIDRIKVDLDFQLLEYPRETPTRIYTLTLRHMDDRTKRQIKLDEQAGLSKERPKRGGGWSYQAASLRGSLLKLGFHKRKR